jgi:hypothetical protein
MGESASAPPLLTASACAAREHAVARRVQGYMAFSRRSVPHLVCWAVPPKTRGALPPARPRGSALPRLSARTPGAEKAGPAPAGGPAEALRAAAAAAAGVARGAAASHPSHPCVVALNPSTCCLEWPPGQKVVQVAAQQLVVRVQVQGLPGAAIASCTEGTSLKNPV